MFYFLRSSDSALSQSNTFTCFSTNLWTSSSVRELFGARTMYAIGTSPAFSSGNLKAESMVNCWCRGFESRCNICSVLSSYRGNKTKIFFWLTESQQRLLFRDVKAISLRALPGQPEESSLNVFYKSNDQI